MPNRGAVRVLDPNRPKTVMRSLPSSTLGSIHRP